jgi:hypothetical protein
MTVSHPKTDNSPAPSDVMKQTIGQLNSFLRGERSAVETYQMAIDKLPKSTFLDVLRTNLVSHEKRVAQIGTKISSMGGTSAKSSGAWGTFAKLIEGGAVALGEKSAVAALEEGEDHGRNDYQRDIGNIEPKMRAFVQGLLDEQMKTHDSLSKLQKRMSADGHHNT